MMKFLALLAHTADTAPILGVAPRRSSLIYLSGKSAVFCLTADR
jgi:hypothetical protein